MNTEFLSSQTRINLMRSFAGESQARNRYTFAQQIALQNNMYIISRIFKITADEEKAHAEVFYNLLNDSNEKDIEITAGYPVNVYNDVQNLLSSSVNNEKNENTIIYPQFAEIATQEGFTKAASKFKLIAEIEDFHRKRFEYYNEVFGKKAVLEFKLMRSKYGYCRYNEKLCNIIKCFRSNNRCYIRRN